MKFLFCFFVLPLFFGMCAFDKEANKTVAVAQKISSANDANPFAFVQLFTSQGCSSCPSADELLQKVKNGYAEKNVFVLSYHVDYWNRLGWKDVFSKKEYSDLQYSYSNKFSGSSVYTPQAIINGDIHFVGSNEPKMNSNLEKYLNISAENNITISGIARKANQITFDYNITGNLTGKDLKVALAIDQKSTSVKRGENSGRKLSSVNIVVEQIAISLKKGTGKASIVIPNLVESNDQLLLVGFTQAQNFEIFGATQEKV